MNRRTFLCGLTLGTLAGPLVSEGQPAGTPIRVGILCLSPCQGLAVDAFRRTLQGLGYIDGRTIVFEYRDADWKVERLPALAGELVERKVDVIFTPWGTAAALAAKRATDTIPVVIGAAGDPIRSGIVASLSKPGGNVTGLSSLALELEGKRVEFAKEVFPKVSRVGTFWHAENPYSTLALKQMETAARALGVRIDAIKLSGPSDLDAAFAILKRDRVEVLVLHGYVATLQHRRAIIDFAAANRVPAVYPLREYADEGGLLSYGANVADISRRAAHYVDRVLKGTKPADLPVEQATTVELVINLKTAKTLGLTIPQSLLVRADEIIQ
jgi:putative ABC transport system substrate-binding protein